MDGDTIPGQSDVKLAACRLKEARAAAKAAAPGAKQKAKEGEKKAAQLEKNAADAAVRALIATPCDEVDIEGAKLTIDEAHEANVMRSLIEKAFEHVQQAVDVQLMEPHNQSPAAELL